MSKIGIIGSGILGQTQKNWLLEHTNNEVLVYDIDESKSNSTLESMAKHADYFILCLPTDPYQGIKLVKEVDYLNTKILESTIEKINSFRNKKPATVIIRSTVPVGFTRRMSQEFPDLNFYFIPEFLTEKVAKEDFEKQKKMVIGTMKMRKEKDRLEVNGIMGLIVETQIEKACLSQDLNNLFPAKDFDSLTYEEAEMIKLATNSFYAMKVIFANELNDICKACGIEYLIIQKQLAENPRIGSYSGDNQGRDVHLRIAQDGKAGYGGKCLTKDTRQLVEIAKDKKAGFGLLETVDKINSKIRK